MQLVRVVFTFYAFFICGSVLAQSGKQLIKQGNKAYAEKDFEKASSSYNEALKTTKENLTSYSNLGNSLFKEKKFDEAIGAYDQALALEKDNLKLSNLHYNKGVAYQTNNKLEECIEAYKKALRISPDDEDARLNLQKALKKQQQDKQEDKKDNKDKKEDKKDKNKPEPEQSKSNLSQKEAEDKLKALMQQEKNLQNKLHKSNNQSSSSPEKDW